MKERLHRAVSPIFTWARAGSNTNKDTFEGVIQVERHELANKCPSLGSMVQIACPWSPHRGVVGVVAEVSLERDRCKVESPALPHAEGFARWVPVEHVSPDLGALAREYRATLEDEAAMGPIVPGEGAPRRARSEALAARARLLDLGFGGAGARGLFEPILSDPRSFPCSPYSIFESASSAASRDARLYVSRWLEELEEAPERRGAEDAAETLLRDALDTEDGAHRPPTTAEIDAADDLVVERAAVLRRAVDLLHRLSDEEHSDAVREMVVGGVRIARFRLRHAEGFLAELNRHRAADKGAP